MKCWIMPVCWLIALSPSAAADEQSLIRTDQQMVSYTLGYQIGICAGDCGRTGGKTASYDFSADGGGVGDVPATAEFKTKLRC